MSAAPEIMAKGLNFRGFLRAMERLYDKPTTDRVIEAVAIPDAQEALRYGKIVSTGWYPVAWHRSLHAAAQSVTRGGRELARKLGYEGTREDLSSVYRVIGSVLGPQTLVRVGNRLWSSYWQGGVVDTIEYGSGHVRTSFRACYGFDRNIWEDIAGSCLAVLEVAGAKDVNMRMLEGGGDGPDLVLDARWRV